MDGQRDCAHCYYRQPDYYDRQFYLYGGTDGVLLGKLRHRQILFWATCLSRDSGGGNGLDVVTLNKEEKDGKKNQP